MNTKTQNKLDYLQETKSLIKTALNEKGIAISDSDTFRSYADSIRNAEFKSDDVRYVTFMNGEATLYVKPVATGDDCVDVKAKGLISTPTKASSVSTVYTYAGWAATNGGAADADVLKAVKEDKTVYAAYTESVRYYTITYYDSDGTTVLKTESLAYGSTPSYSPTKIGYDFVAWQPTPAPVTGNASYTATWKEKAAFGTATWEEISSWLSNGTVLEYVSLGDTRTVTLTHDDGTTEDVTFEVVDTNISDLGDFSNATLALLATHPLKTPRAFHNVSSSASLYYAWADILKYMRDTLANCFPSDMQEVMINTQMPFASAYSKVHIPTNRGLGYKYDDFSAFDFSADKTNAYEAFRNGKTLVCKDESGNAVEWWIANTGKASKVNNNLYPFYVSTDGKPARSTNATNEIYIRPLVFI